MTETAAPALRIRYSRTATHIEGFGAATTGGGNDMGDHVSAYALNHCSALTRGATRMGHLTHTVEVRHEDDPTVPAGRVRRAKMITEFDSAQAAYDAALKLARRNGGERICAKCTAAAQAAGAQV